MVSGHVSKISLVVGVTFLVVGITLIKPFIFSLEAFVFLLLGGAFFSIAFVTHFQVHKNSTRLEKIFVACGALAIFLIVLAMAVYTIVEVKKEVLETSIPIGHLQRRPTQAVKLVPIPIYSSVSLILAVAGLILLFYSLYIKTKYL